MADKQDHIGEGFDALSQFFVADGTLGDALTRVAELSCQVSGADMAGITLLVEGRPRTGVFTDPEAPEIDEAQYDTGQGPCLDAFRNRRTFRIESTAHETRWPDFTRAAAARGITCTLSLPIIARGEGLGALNLYARAPGTFDDQPDGDLDNFVRQAAMVMANARVFWDERQLNENLRQALRSRATIDHAIGILMAPGGRSPEDGFQLLVRASQRENRKLREIAEDIVRHAETREGPPPLS